MIETKKRKKRDVRGSEKKAMRGSGIRVREKTETYTERGAKRECLGENWRRERGCFW